MFIFIYRLFFRAESGTNWTSDLPGKTRNGSPENLNLSTEAVKIIFSAAPEGKLFSKVSLTSSVAPFLLWP